MKALRDSLFELEIKRVIGPTPVAKNGHDLHFAALSTMLRSIDFSFDFDLAEKFLKLLLVHIGHRLEHLSMSIFHPYDPIFNEGHPMNFEAYEWDIPPRMDSNLTYLELLMLHTGNLRSLSFKRLTPALSLRSVAVANSRLRFVNFLAVFYRYGPGTEKWVTALFDDFISNCLDLVDISLDHDYWNCSHDRIAQLDTLCTSLGARRKVGVRVDKFTKLHLLSMFRSDRFQDFFVNLRNLWDFFPICT